MVGKDKSGALDKHTHTAMYKITNKNVLSSTGNSTQYFVMIQYRKRIQKTVDLYLIHSATQQKRTHCKSTIFQFKKLLKTPNNKANH